MVSVLKIILFKGEITKEGDGSFLTLMDEGYPLLHVRGGHILPLQKPNITTILRYANISFEMLFLSLMEWMGVMYYVVDIFCFHIFCFCFLLCVESDIYLSITQVIFFISVRE